MAKLDTGTIPFWCFILFFYAKLLSATKFLIKICQRAMLLEDCILHAVVFSSSLQNCVLHVAVDPISGSGAYKRLIVLNLSGVVVFVPGTGDTEQSSPQLLPRGA